MCRCVQPQNDQFMGCNTCCTQNSSVLLITHQCLSNALNISSITMADTNNWHVQTCIKQHLGKPQMYPQPKLFYVLDRAKEGYSCQVLLPSEALLERFLHCLSGKTVVPRNENEGKPLQQENKQKNIFKVIWEIRENLSTLYCCLFPQVSLTSHLVKCCPQNRK